MPGDARQTRWMGRNASSLAASLRPRPLAKISLLAPWMVQSICWFASLGTLRGDPPLWAAQNALLVGAKTCLILSN